MRRLRYWVRGFFGISRQEADGFIILCLLIVVMLAFPWFLPVNTEPFAFTEEEIRRTEAWLATFKKVSEEEIVAKPTFTLPDKSQLFAFDPNQASEDQFIQLGLPPFMAKRIIKYRNSGGKFSYKSDILRIYDFPEDFYEVWKPYINLPDKLEGNKKKLEKAKKTSKPDLFIFDPNTATVAELERLGLPRYMAERIEKYRNSGGKFRSEEDILKIYDFPQALYEQWKPYIQIGEADNATGQNQESTPQTKYTPKTIAPFDLNSATIAQLTQIRGIGEYRAEKIIQFRDKLGGFYAAEQVRETYQLPDSVADLLLEVATSDAATVRKINLNTADLETLKAHPYIRYTMAKLIISYRKEHGNYNSVDQLHNIRPLKAEEVERVKPYLTTD